MKGSMKKYLVGLILGTIFIGCGKTEDNKTFKGKNVRVVIGSTSTSGDSYLIADTASRHLEKALDAKIKVDAVGAAEALATMQSAKPDGNTIMIFHDMTYLGVDFGAYDKEYDLKNMTIGPRIAQNPGAIWAAKKDAPYNTLVEIPQYLIDNPDKTIRMACEAGGVSHIGFITYYDWVKKNYGEDLAKRIVVVIGGSTADKTQLLWDNNCDVIFADYTSLKDYTETDDKKIAMKFVGLLDNIEGVDVKSYKDMGITLDGKDFAFSKDFLVYMPKGVAPELIKELDMAANSISKTSEYNEALGKMKYRSEYLDSTSAAQFINNKRDGIKKLIETSPSLDELVKK